MSLLSRTFLFAVSIVLTATAGAIGPEVPPMAQFRLKVFADAAERDRLAAGGYDIAGHDLAAAWVEVVASTDELGRLAADGFRFEILDWRPEPRPLGDDGTDVPLPDTRYTDPQELGVFLDQVHADHPEITRLVDLGTTHQGRTIRGMMISDNAAVDEDELAILFNAAHHAREVMTPEIVMDTIDYLTDNYGVDPDVTARVDAYEIWCVPMVNPDGVARVHEVDDFWRKNTRDNDDNGTIDSFDGVDLNRNYEWGWGFQCRGSSGTTFSETYRGPFEGSEPEAQAMLALGRRIRPVFDVEYHSYGEDVFYAMSCDPQFNPKLSTISGPDQDVSRVLAEDYASRIVQADGGTGFGAAPYGSPVDGTGRDQQYHENGAIAFVTEVNNAAEGGFHPDYGTWRDATVEGQRPAWLWLIDRISGPAIGGHVVDAVTGEPLEADVGLDELTLPDGKRLTSRADTGRFHIIVVEGAYTLRVRAAGYEPATIPVDVGPEWTPLRVELMPVGSSRLVVESFEDGASTGLWTVGAPGDSAISGVWAWGEPFGTHEGTVPDGNLTFGNARLDRTPGEAVRAFVTGNAPSSNLTVDDVDGGATTLTSPPFDLDGWYGVEVSWQRWFRKDVVDPQDTMVAEVSADGGSTWLELELLDASTSSGDATPAWVPATVRLDELVAPGPDVRFRFRATDAFPDGVVEAAIDDLEVRGFSLVAQGRVRNLRGSGGASTAWSWEPVPGGEGAVYDVVRGDLAALSGGAGGVALGTLTCIENDSPDTSTSGNEDDELPTPGTGFFYLVRFRLGFSEGDLGTGSEGGPRTGTGGCDGS